MQNPREIKLKLICFASYKEQKISNSILNAKMDPRHVRQYFLNSGYIKLP